MPRSVFVDFKAVKAAVSMLQILDHYNLTERFKRSGDNLSGSCPLHDGTNPTQFRVSISKNCWHCFGDCRMGGNVLDFVARCEDVTIRDAAIKINEWFNLPLDRGANGESKPSPGSRPNSKKPKKTSIDAKDTGPNKPLGFELKNLDPAHPYFAERGLNEETISEFGLGFCGKGSMAGRIVIPTHNAEGQLVAYAGRWPGEPPEDTPKYKLPSGFRKAQELFNLHRALQQSDDQPVVIVEGFFGCFHLWQHGVRNVIALMGSSLSEAQETHLKTHLPPGIRILLMLDEDEAGKSAREEILKRLVTKFFVRQFQFDEPNQQPEHLTAEQLSFLCT